jgi:hypothetical protein
MFPPIPWVGLADWRQRLKSDYDQWVKAYTSLVEEIEVLLKRLKVHQLILVDFLNPELSTLVDSYPVATYIETDHQ